MEERVENRYELPDYAKDLMSFICDTLGNKDFILYGGAAVDLIRDKECQVNDYDIAISGKTQENIRSVRESLRRNGFRIIEPYRRYKIYHDMEVALVYAQRDGVMLDICFMDDVKTVGQFNLESLYWDYRDMQCVDDYDAVRSIAEKTIVSIRGLDKENVFLLTSRFLYLCSKYDICLTVSDNYGILDNLRSRLDKEGGRGEVSAQYISCLSAVFRSILKSGNRESFIRQLVDCGIMRYFYLAMHGSLERIIKNGNELEVIRTAEDKKVLADIVEKHMAEGDRRALREKLEAISARKWNEQDRKLREFL